MPEQDLAEWLLEQIAEDERLARAVVDRSAPWDGQWRADGQHAVRTYNGWCLAYGHGAHSMPEGFAEHVAVHDPARVLAECGAKRRIIAEHVVFQPAPDVAPPVSVTDCPTCGGTETCPTLRLLALPFADRPGYREEWRL